MYKESIREIDHPFIDMRMQPHPESAGNQGWWARYLPQFCRGNSAPPPFPPVGVERVGRQHPTVGSTSTFDRSVGLLVIAKESDSLCGTCAHVGVSVCARPCMCMTCGCDDLEWGCLPSADTPLAWPLWPAAVAA